MNTISCLFFLVVLLGNTALCFSYKKKSISDIGFLFMVYWVINIILGYTIFAFSREWNFISLALLLLYVDIFAFIYINVVSKQKVVISNFANCDEKPKLIRNILIFTLVCGFGYVYYELTSNGFGLSNLTSEEGLMESGYYFTDGRYGGSTEIQVPLIGQILLMINYAGFCFAGYVYKLGLAKKKYSFLPFIPMICSTLATTAKTLVVSGALLWITGYIVAKIIDSNEKNVRTINIRKLLLPVTVVLFFFYMSFVIRYQSNDPIEIINRLFVYMVGHVPCYDDWFNRFDVNLLGYSYGQQSFQFIFGPKMPNELRNVCVVPYLQTQYGWTNVNTLFAYIYMDFGYIGSAVFFGIFGFVTAKGRNAIISRCSPIGHSIVALSIYEILYSFLISAMKYTSIVGSFVVFGAFVYIVNKKIRKL